MAEPTKERLQVWLGEGEVRDRPPHDLRHRPPGLPVKVPQEWWESANRFLEARKQAVL